MKNLIQFGCLITASYIAISCCTTIGGQHVCVTNPSATPTGTEVSPTSIPQPTSTPSVIPIPTSTATPIQNPTAAITQQPPVIDMTAVASCPAGGNCEITQHYIVSRFKINPLIFPEMPNPDDPANADFWANRYDGKQSARNCDNDHFYNPVGGKTVMWWICGGSIKYNLSPRSWDVARAEQPFKIGCSLPSTVLKYPARDYYQVVFGPAGGSCAICVPANATTEDGILMPVSVACASHPIQ